MAELSSSSSRPPPPPPLKPLDLDLTIVSAKHLKNVNWRNGDLKPYVVFWINPESKLATKSDDSGSNNPVWNERFTIPIPFAVRDSVLMLEVFHSKPSETPKPLVGTLRVPLVDIGEEHCTYDLIRPSGRPQGKIRLKIAIGETYQFPSQMSSYYYIPSTPPAPPPRDYYRPPMMFPPPPHLGGFPPPPPLAGFHNPYYQGNYHSSAPPPPRPLFDNRTSGGSLFDNRTPGGSLFDNRTSGGSFSDDRTPGGSLFDNNRTSGGSLFDNQTSGGSLVDINRTSAGSWFDIRTLFDNNRTTGGSSYGGGPSAPVDYSPYDNQRLPPQRKMGLGAGLAAGGIAGLSLNDGINYEEEKIETSEVESELNPRTNYKAWQSDY